MNLANLAMVTGHIGVENAGVNPLRGQNNVQGSCDMGALPNSFPGYPSVNDAQARAKFSAAYGVPMPEKMGLRIPEMLDMAVYGKLKAMYIMGEDPALTDADANHVRKALGSLEFLVVQNLFMTETAKYADVFLPAACYAEKDGTFTNTERRVQRVRKAVEPPGQCRPDWQIIADLVLPPGPRDALRLARGDLRRDARAGAAATPASPTSASTRCGLQWPCPDADHPGTQFLHAGQLHPRQGPAAGHRVRGAGRALQRRVPDPAHHRAHALPLQHHDPALGRASRCLRPHELAQINPADAERLALGEGDMARVTSRRGSITTRVTVTDTVPPGVVFMTFHYKESPVNELTNSAFDPVTKTAEFKVCAVRIEKEEVDPLSPANKLIFVTGPISGTKMFGGNRYGVHYLSPLTGGYGECTSGGNVAPQFARTGYKVVIVQGAADAPVYLEVSEDGAAIHPADDLWGLDTYEAEERLMRQTLR